MGGISLAQVVGIIVVIAVVFFWQRHQRNKAIAQQKQEIDNKQE